MAESISRLGQRQAPKHPTFRNGNGLADRRRELPLDGQLHARLLGLPLPELAAWFGPGTGELWCIACQDLGRGSVKYGPAASLFRVGASDLIALRCVLCGAVLTRYELVHRLMRDPQFVADALMHQAWDRRTS